VSATQNRAEKVDGQFDFVVSRAVTAFPKFVALIRGKISGRQQNSLGNGVLYLKGGDFSDELKPFKKQVQVYALSEQFEEKFFETKKLIHLPLKKPLK
jgi:16S rRNA (guanine527-N7)-methyltransferase